MDCSVFLLLREDFCRLPATLLLSPAPPHTPSNQNNEGRAGGTNLPGDNLLICSRSQQEPRLSSARLGPASPPDMSDPYSEKWANYLLCLGTRKPWYRQTCLIIFFNEHRLHGFLIHGDRYFIYGGNYPFLLCLRWTVLFFYFLQNTSYTWTTRMLYRWCSVCFSQFMRDLCRTRFCRRVTKEFPGYTFV